MAGDWIKMRSELQSHPKVVRILSAMRPHDVQNATDKFRVIGGLHAAWSVFDTHSTDGVLFGYTPDLLNHVIGWPGFAEAMIAVDWLSFDGRETLTLPEFDEHNGQSAKRRAEDQKRKRDGRKCPQSVRNLSANGADKKRNESGLDKREDKREEQKQKNTPDGELFDGIPEQVAHDFKQLRQKLRAPITATAMAGIRREAEKAGLTTTAALAMCCERGWRGFKAEWVTGQPTPPPAKRRKQLGEGSSTNYGLPS